MTLQLKIGNGKYESIHIVWLRDNCRCSECFDQDLLCKKLTIEQFLITMKIKIKNYMHENDSLYVEWSDGHKSTYNSKWVIDMWTRKTKRIEPYTSFGGELEKLPPRLSYDEVTQEKGLKELLTSILKYGVGIVTNVEPTLDATEKLIRLIAQPQQTIFGTMWTVGNIEKREDPSYSNGPLIVHNDNTYLVECGGLQVFHMLERAENGEGGWSTLMDGFKVAEILKQENPLHFKVLTEVELETEYIEPMLNCRLTGPVIRIDRATNEVCQIRFNIYDRTAQPPSRCDIDEFYESYTHFVQILQREEMYWKYILQPGTVVINNNWRMLHGRTAFTGKRIFCGCYISMTEVWSKARMLGLMS